MNVTITPTTLSGTVTPPASKSQAHRAVLALALSGGDRRLENLSFSQDLQATRRCAAALISGPSAGGLPLFDCGESGSTLRFLIPIALALRGGGRFSGRGRLMERPLGPYFDIFDQKGIFYRLEDGILTVRGQLPPGEYRLPGNVSSQFITGLLFALPLLEGESRIVLTTELESRDYVAMTLDILRRSGVTAASSPDFSRFHIPGGQRFRARGLALESDWSQAAFWYAANALGSRLAIRGLNEASVQGDRRVTALLEQLARPGLAALDVSQCPDLAPPLAAAAAVRRGNTRIAGAGRLRAKESDRLSAITRVLTAMGARVSQGQDSLFITGGASLPGGAPVDCHGDHRIAMMAAIAATRCDLPVTLLGAQCVAKSYPTFWDDYRMLGGIIREYPGE